MGLYDSFTITNGEFYGIPYGGGPDTYVNSCSVVTVMRVDSDASLEEIRNKTSEALADFQPKLYSYLESLGINPYR